MRLKFPPLFAGGPLAIYLHFIAFCDARRRAVKRKEVTGFQNCGLTGGSHRVPLSPFLEITVARARAVPSIRLIFKRKLKPVLRPGGIFLTRKKVTTSAPIPFGSMCAHSSPSSFS